MCRTRPTSVPARTMIQPSAITRPFARLTHQREHASLRARSALPQRTTLVSRLMHRRKQAPNRLREGRMAPDDGVPLAPPPGPEHSREHPERYAVAANESYLFLITRTRIAYSKPRLRTVGATSNRPPAGLMQAFATSNGLNPPFARFSARKPSCGSLAPRSCRRCRGWLPPMPEAVVTAARSCGRRARWSRNAWALRLQCARAVTSCALRSSS
jgi:hypothetical protein